MVALPQTYNVDERDERGGGSMPLIPPGQYQAVIVGSELKDTSAKTGKFLALTVVITQGPHANTEFIERLNIINPNDVAVKIAYDTLAEISKATGMTQTPADSNELHNKPMMIEVVTEPGNEYTDNQGLKQMGKDKSVIKKYLPLPAAGVPAATQPVQQQAATAQQAAPQQQSAQAPATNPFAAPQS